VQKVGNRAFVMIKGNGQNNAQSSGQNNLQNNRRQAKAGTAGNKQSAPDSSQNSGLSSLPANGKNADPSENAPTGGIAGGGFRGGLQNSQYYAGAMPVLVELGINNDTYIEIVSGLQEGQEVILPPLASSSTQDNAQTRAGIGGMGGLGGLGGGGNNRNPQPRND